MLLVQVSRFEGQRSKRSYLGGGPHPLTPDVFLHFPIQLLAVLQASMTKNAHALRVFFGLVCYACEIIWWRWFTNRTGQILTRIVSTFIFCSESYRERLTRLIIHLFSESSTGAFLDFPLRCCLWHGRSLPRLPQRGACSGHGDRLKQTVSAMAVVLVSGSRSLEILNEKLPSLLVYLQTLDQSVHVATVLLDQLHCRVTNWKCEGQLLTHAQLLQLKVVGFAVVAELVLRDDARLGVLDRLLEEQIDSLRCTICRERIYTRLSWWVWVLGVRIRDRAIW